MAANGLVPTFLAMSYSFATGGPEYLLGVNNAFETPLAAAFIGYYGCCCGDTWSSELGVLSRKMPRLITTGKECKPGTNGGVTTLGLVASAAGGFAVGFAFWCGGLFVPVVTGNVGLALQFAAQWPVLVIGLGAGLVGSLIDSLLGATIQFSGYCSERRRMVSKPGPTVTKDERVELSQQQRRQLCHRVALRADTVLRDDLRGHSQVKTRGVVWFGSVRFGGVRVSRVVASLLLSSSIEQRFYYHSSPPPSELLLAWPALGVLNPPVRPGRMNCTTRIMNTT